MIDVKFVNPCICMVDLVAMMSLSKLHSLMEGVGFGA